MTEERRHDQEAEQLAQILDTVSQKVPQLIRALKDTLYSEQAGRDLGKAVGAFYKELVASGIDSQIALVMAKDYIGSLQGALKGMSSDSSKER